MKHIVILIACAMLSACKEKPEVQTWKMTPESEWTEPTNRLEVTGGTYPVQWKTNLPPLQSLMIGDSQIFTNIVISNNYSGTIQIGMNFATVKELDTWVTVLSSMKSAAEAWPAITNENPLTAFTEYRRFTYTVNVADGLWTHTNVIEIVKCSDFCTRLRYVDGDVTNDFHAAFASFTVKTNSP